MLGLKLNPVGNQSPLPVGFTMVIFTRGLVITMAHFQIKYVNLGLHCWLRSVRWHQCRWRVAHRYMAVFTDQQPAQNLGAAINCPGYIPYNVITQNNSSTCYIAAYTCWIHQTMMTSSNGNIFRVTGTLCREFTGSRWIPRTKASDAELWYFLWSAPE